MSEKTIFVTVNLTSVSLSVAGFGVPLIMTPAEDTVFPTRVKEYASLTEVAVDFASGTVQYDAAQAIFSQSTPPEKIKFGRVEAADADYTAAVTACGVEDSDWYFLLTTSRTAANQEDLAEYAETEKKFFVCADDDKASPIGVTLDGLGYDQSKVYYSSTADGTTDDQWLDMAMVGRMAPTTPGETTWSEQQPVGVTADELTSAEITALKAINVDFLTTKLGLSLTYVGKNASGEWSDVIRFKDWLKARTEESLTEQTVSKAAANKKVPYTSAGIAMREQAIDKVMALGVANGGLASYEIITPDITDVSSQDKLDRVLRNIVTNGTLAGAILYTYVTINLAT